MKKLLYSLAVAFAGIAALTGCTTSTQSTMAKALP